MRAADFSWEAPPSPVKTTISSSAIYCSFDCVTSATPFPQKSQTLASKICERMPPPKPPLTAVSEPDPIYPYLPFLFWASRWQRLCQFALVPKHQRNSPVLLVKLRIASTTPRLRARYIPTFRTPLVQRSVPKRIIIARYWGVWS